MSEQIKTWLERFNALPIEAQVMSNYTKAMNDTEADLRARIAELEAALSRRPAAAPEATPGGNGAAEQPAAEPGLLPDGREQFELYATNLGLRDFEVNQDDASDYRNPFTQGHWRYWRASREAARAHLRAAGQGSKDSERLDAERYRFIRDNMQDGYELPGGFYLPDHETSNWDRTIDAAIAKAKGEQQ